MPTVALNKNALESLLRKKYSIEQLKERIPMLGVNLEKIENDEIHVEVFPNRPDMLSEQGFARAFSSFVGIKTGLRQYKVKKSGHKVIVDSSVVMRPFTACAIIKNLKFTEEKLREIIQLQEKLAMTHGRNRKKSAYGIYPLSEIVFPISYIAKDAVKIKFRPLGFNTEITASQIPETHPKGIAFRHLTEGWKKYPFFIDARNRVLSMLPFTNSEDTGKVDEQTKEVFVECTGTNLNNVMIALNIISTALADMGGDIYSVDVVYRHETITTPDLTPSKMKLDLSYINKRLGLSLKEKEAALLLEKMGYGNEKGKVLIPGYRADILHQVDLAEDIAIAYGLENFNEKIPCVATIGEESKQEMFLKRIREILIGLRLLEVKNYHLITSQELSGTVCQQDAVPLRNSVGNYCFLRNSLLPSLLKNLAENQHNEYPQNIFELGRTFETEPKMETGILEKECLGIALCHEKADFTELRQVLDALFASLGLVFTIKEMSLEGFIPGRGAEIVLNNQLIGIIGEIHPAVLEKWNLVVPAAALEINLKEILKKGYEE